MVALQTTMTDFSSSTAARYMRSSGSFHPVGTTQWLGKRHRPSARWFVTGVVLRPSQVAHRHQPVASIFGRERSKSSTAKPVAASLRLRGVEAWFAIRSVPADCACASTPP